MHIWQKKRVNYVKFKNVINCVNQLFNLNAFFFFLLTGATWYYYTIYLVFTYYYLHFLWTLFVKTFCENFLWTIFVDTICGHFLWTNFVDTFCWHFLWTLFFVWLFVDKNRCFVFVSVFLLSSKQIWDPHPFLSVLVLMLVSKSVKRFSGSRMRDFCNIYTFSLGFL